MLPSLPNKQGVTKWRSADFRGIRHVPGAQAGDIWDCHGVTADDWPVLRTVDWTKRKYDANNKGIYGSYQYGVSEIERIYVNAGALYCRDTQVYSSAALDRKQRIVAFNTYALIFPAKLFVRTDVKGLCATAAELPESAAYGDVYAVASGGGYEAKYWDGGAWVSLGAMAGEIGNSETASCTFTDGTYAGEAAEANTIKRSGGTWTGFRVGDAVTISGAADAENNKTVIIREISGDELRFYEHSFTDNATAASITVARTVPDLDWLCVNENRVWGCKGQHICASKLGDFRNWNVFDGLASDSYAVDVFAGGDFTGCVSFLGYPVFMKRDGIYKVYGNKPSNFEVMGSASTGTVNGDTLAVASETLFYLSARGVMAYSGGIPSPVSEDLGALVTGSADAFGVSDGRKYYFGYKTGAVYEYDPERRMWHKQVYDAGAAVTETVNGQSVTVPVPTNIAYGYRGHAGAVFVTDRGYRYGDITAGGSMNDDYAVTFAEADFGSFGSKYPTRLWLRLESEKAVTVTVSYNGGAFEAAYTFAAGGKSAVTAPVPIRRCDRFAVKLTGSGQLRLYAMELELRAEQTNRKGG